jgi:hypothetical protein
MGENIRAEVYPAPRGGLDPYKRRHREIIHFGESGFGSAS